MSAGVCDHLTRTIADCPSSYFLYLLNSLVCISTRDSGVLSPPRPPPTLIETYFWNQLWVSRVSLSLAKSWFFIQSFLINSIVLQHEIHATFCKWLYVFSKINIILFNFCEIFCHYWRDNRCKTGKKYPLLILVTIGEPNRWCYSEKWSSFSIIHSR